MISPFSSRRSFHVPDIRDNKLVGFKSVPEPAGAQVPVKSPHTFYTDGRVAFDADKLANQLRAEGLEYLPPSLSGSKIVVPAREDGVYEPLGPGNGQYFPTLSPEDRKRLPSTFPRYHEVAAEETLTGFRRTHLKASRGFQGDSPKAVMYRDGLVAEGDNLGKVLCKPAPEGSLTPHVDRNGVGIFVHDEKGQIVRPDGRRHALMMAAPVNMGRHVGMIFHESAIYRSDGRILAVAASPSGDGRPDRWVQPIDSGVRLFPLDTDKNIVDPDGTRHPPLKRIYVDGGNMHVYKDALIHKKTELSYGGSAPPGQPPAFLHQEDIPYVPVEPLTSTGYYPGGVSIQLRNNKDGTFTEPGSNRVIEYTGRVIWNGEPSPQYERYDSNEPAPPYATPSVRPEAGPAINPLSLSERSAKT